MATSKEIKDGYTSTLQDLTCNSKPLISVLTMLAEENVAHAKDIVEAIEAHLTKVRNEVKLPVLYLIDCIIKNVGGPYSSHFCTNIVTLFCSVFQVVDEKTRTEMYKLRQTWNEVLPKSKLYALDVQTKQMDPAWPITAPPPNIHFNPKFLKPGATIKNDATNTKPVTSVNPTAADPTTLDMQQKLIIKQRELLELQQKKLELELLQTQVKLQEQLKKSTPNVTNNSEEIVKAAQTAKQLLLKPEVAKQLLDDSSDHSTLNKALIMNQRVNNNTTNIGNNVPKIAPVNSALIAASRPTRDPRLLRQQTAQQINVNSNVQLENKSNTTNTLDNKVVSNKISSRVERSEARFVNNKDEPPKTTKTLSRIPLKSKRSSSPNNSKTSASTKSGRNFKSGSGSISLLDSPSKSSKSSRSSSKSPSKYKKSITNNSSSSSTSTRYDKKSGGKSSKSDRKSPIKDGFKDVKGATKNRNYMRRNREVSVSPEPDSRHDVDLRLGGPPGKQARIQTDSKEEKCDISIQGMDVDLRHMPAIVGKKRPSTEATEPSNAKKSKSEMFDFLFGNEDVDLRQLQVKNTRPPTPPPPIISNKTQVKSNNSNEKENSTRNGSPAKEIAPKVNLDALRAKLANATNKDKIKQTRFNAPDEPKKLSLDDTLKKIIISPADEECIKAGNMTKQQESALMSKIIAQIENQKLKEAKRKEIEDTKESTFSDDEIDHSPDEGSEKPTDRFRDSGEDYGKHSGYEPRVRRPTVPLWRGSRRGGFVNPRGPIRPPRPGIEPWIRPLSTAPQWRPPFLGNKYDDNMHPDLMDTRSNSPIFSNSNDASDLVMNCSNQYDSKSINIDGQPRDIIFYDETAIAFMSWEDPREITFQDGTRRVQVDDESFVLAFNDPYREVLIKGSPHTIRLGAPTREIYIDGKPYECYFDGPGITIDLDGHLVLVTIEGPAPQVKIGTVRKTELVAGKVNLIIDAKIIVPVYLDARKQTFDIDGKVHTLKFTDALQTVLINDVPFKVEFGGLPKPINVNEKKHFVRFSVLPRGIKPGVISIKDMDGWRPPVTSDNESSQDACDNTVIIKKKSRFSDDSPERSGNSPISIQNLLQQPTIGNLDSFLSNVMAGTPSSNAPAQSTLGYQIENTTMDQQHVEPQIEFQQPETAPPPILPPSLNINELFQKLVATGIVTSNVPVIPPAPILPTPLIAPPPVIPEEHFEPVEPVQTKPRRADLAWKPVDFGRPNTLKIRQPALINALYSGMQCSSCGMRFSPEQSMLYSQHLDWHFRQNRKGKKNIRKATSRRWYYSITDWSNYEEIEDLDEREKCYFENQQKEQMDGANEDCEEEIEIPSVPADSDVPDPHCEVCQEKFEQFYNEEKEEWHLRMAVRIDGRTYHPLCYEDYQASLLNATMEESALPPIEEEKSKDIEIPGLELPKEEEDEGENTPEIVIDDAESTEATDVPKDEEVEETTDENSKQDMEVQEEETKDTVDKEDEDEEDDDDVIINEVQPERIILDEYEFKNLDENEMITNFVIKQEPVDDGFTDIENFNLGDVKIKLEPTEQDEEFEDIGLVTEAPTDVPKEAISTPTNASELVTSIDGNVEINSGVPQPSGISGKIKINISKQLPVIAPKENKDISLDVDNNIEPSDPTQPLPPGEEPIQLNLKPALQGIELKKLPPVNKGSELTGLCSIM